ncbi:hypothetical protein Acr_00g0054590 [Actinidia rufa]|uniref:Ankyrin repeat family protein n=1 Tax=Actinidia rufa TaxID=165716 RepID=A0A7J0DLN3_9ERIC|nr:hypothetical protein Acr_00g0054590 [Actinidia rufa]
MGHGLSCAASHEHGLFTAVQFGDLETVKTLLQRNPSLVNQTTVYDRQSALHIAAANGQIEIVSMLLGRSVKPDLLNRHKQTPLMLAAMHGRFSCVQKLIEAGANILMFDSINGRTCLHYAAYYGHSDCLKAILSAARSSHVAASWMGKEQPHCTWRPVKGGPQCVHLLLDNGALVCASTSGYGFPGSTPLHLAARGGSLDCIRELLAWGADRLQRDASGRIPHMVALKHKHGACATLLNPSSAEPLVWPSPLKFISELNAEAKALLEHALMEANREREKRHIERDSLFNAISIGFANLKTGHDIDHDINSSKLRRSRKSRNLSEGSSSFKGLSAMGSFGKMGGRGSGRIATENELVDKS